MNRYRGPAIGGSSKATATTQCQKCLKRGHYSYECQSVPQDRPYVSRPSRTQQLFNPKLVPKLTSDVPQDLLRKKGVADEQLAKAELERGRKRERQIEDLELGGASKRIRSTSSSSVSTISTSRSRSPPRVANTGPNRHSKSRSMSRSRSRSRLRSVPPRQDSGTEKKRRRGSSTSSSGSEDSQLNPRDTRDRIYSRSTRRRYSQQSPSTRGRHATSDRSPGRGRRRHSNDRRLSHEGPKILRGLSRDRSSSDLPHERSRKEEGPRDRSLSPFSKRLAMTKTINMR